MEIVTEQIVMTKAGKNDSLYVKFNDKGIAFEIMRRGNIAKAKKNDIKVSNYIPPQCYGRWSAAWVIAKEIEKKEQVAMVTVRLGKDEVRILFKDDMQGEWKDAIVPKDLPNWDNAIVWDGLTKTTVLKDIKDFSPIKGELPSMAEMKKRKERTPDGKEDKRTKI